MARASEQDLDCAQQISSFLEQLQQGYVPECMLEDADSIEFFYDDDASACQRVLRKLLEIAEQGSLFRVTFGMLVLMDPANKLLDPDAETLEAHPDIVAALDAMQAKEA